MHKDFRTICLAAAGLSCIPPNESIAQVVDRAEPLQEIIVYGARQPITAERSGSAVTLLGSEQIELDGRLTVGELLRGLPGISLSRSGGQGGLTQLRMRGGEANHVAVFIDGVKVNDPSQSGEFDFAHLLTEGIERIEVVRGPQSALWGSDALSGVVNIVSATPESGLHGNAAAESGSDGWHRISGGVGAAGQRGNIILNVANIETDGYNVSRTGDGRDGYENTSFRIAGRLNLSGSVDLSLSLRSIDSKSDFDGTDFSTGLPADRLNTVDKQQFVGAMRLLAETFDGRWLHEVRLDRLDVENEANTENPFAVNGFDFALSNSVVDTLVYQTSVDLTDKHRITGAIEQRDETFVQRGPVSFGDPNRDEQMDTRSVVLEYDVRPTENLSLLMSWRNDDNSHFDDTMTKRISGVWRLNESGTRLRAAYGEGIKNPTFTERFGFFTDFIGNPSLIPERAQSRELGIDHSFRDINMNFSATVFDEDLENEINGFVFDAAVGGFTSSNQSGKSERQGIELAGAWNPSDNFAMQFSWTALDAEEFDSLDVASREIRRPEQAANLGMQLRSVADRLNIGVSIAWSSQQDDFFFPPVPPFQERVTLDSFNVVTLSAEYELAPAVSLYGRIENAFDDEYEEIFGFRNNARQVFVGLRYRL